MPNSNPYAELLTTARADLPAAGDAVAREAWQRTYLGRNSQVANDLRELGALAPDDRKVRGAAANAARQELQALLDTVGVGGASAAAIDPTVPGAVPPTGHPHPLSEVMHEIEAVFLRMGFSIIEGPEVEDDWHNFEALNMGPDHPARDMQDTFYLAGSEDGAGGFKLLPRTHTSGMQLRAMMESEPPVRIVVPGRVYRNENEDATHSAVFYQLEGLMVDTTTSFADLKGILLTAAKGILGDDTKLRFRPSYFPYTEPSAEIDMSHPDVLGGRWIELGGSGMVHPNVLENAGWDSKKYRGFAFGLGPSRLAMLKYGISDLRPFFRPDIRILEQI